MLGKEDHQLKVQIRMIWICLLIDRYKTSQCLRRLLLLLSCFSHVRLCAIPQTAAHQAPLSLGFSRQEHWSGLSFPSPMHESEKWKWSHSVVSDSLWPHGLQPTRLLHPWDFPGKSTGVGCHWYTLGVIYSDSRKIVLDSAPCSQFIKLVLVMVWCIIF